MKNKLTALAIIAATGYGAYTWYESDVCRRHGISNMAVCDSTKAAMVQHPNARNNETFMQYYSDHGAIHVVKQSRWVTVWDYAKKANNVRKEIM